MNAFLHKAFQNLVSLTAECRMHPWESYHVTKLQGKLRSGDSNSSKVIWGYSGTLCSPRG